MALALGALQLEHLFSFCLTHKKKGWGGGEEATLLFFPSLWLATAVRTNLPVSRVVQSALRRTAARNQSRSWQLLAAVQSDKSGCKLTLEQLEVVWTPEKLPVSPIMCAVAAKSPLSGTGGKKKREVSRRKKSKSHDSQRGL